MQHGLDDFTKAHLQINIICFVLVANCSFAYGSSYKQRQICTTLFCRGYGLRTMAVGAYCHSFNSNDTDDTQLHPELDQYRNWFEIIKQDLHDTFPIYSQNN